jgi:hypothetical protein
MLGQRPVGGPHIGNFHPILVRDVDTEVDDHALAFKDRRILRRAALGEDERRAADFLGME